MVATGTGLTVAVSQGGLQALKGVVSVPSRGGSMVALQG